MSEHFWITRGKKRFYPLGPTHWAKPRGSGAPACGARSTQDRNLIVYVLRVSFQLGKVTCPDCRRVGRIRAL